MLCSPNVVTCVLEPQFGLRQSGLVGHRRNRPTQQQPPKDDDEANNNNKRKGKETRKEMSQ